MTHKQLPILNVTMKSVKQDCNSIEFINLVKN